MMIFDCVFRFLDKLFDFFKPEQKDGFNSIQLTDSLSNVTCRSLMAFADLLVYPFRPSKNRIKVLKPIIIEKSNFFSLSPSTSQVISLRHFYQQLIMH